MGPTGWAGTGECRDGVRGQAGTGRFLDLRIRLSSSLPFYYR